METNTNTLNYIEGQLVDLHQRSIYPARLDLNSEGFITAITPLDETSTEALPYIMPGFVDAHVHIESSMLTPQHFGALVLPHGTVAVVTDPHEIGNVLGVEGVRFMVSDARHTPLRCCFCIPSCVPATPLDRAGAVISPADVAEMAASGQFYALSEMMNVPGVLQHDPEVWAKLNAVKQHGLPIDGHAPLLQGEALAQYAAAGISTCHESMTLEEGREKIALGMHILIREGSAARNYAALHTLLDESPERIMFCTDDAHPDDIMERGHIDKHVRQAISDGHDLFDVLRAASLNPINHYRLPLGQLRKGDKADFIVVENLTTFPVLATYIAGRAVYTEAHGLAQAVEQPTTLPNNFDLAPVTPAQLRRSVGKAPMPTIGLIPNELVTDCYTYTPKIASDNLEADLEDDVLKIVYVNRYGGGTPQVAYIHGFGLKSGAIASSIGHDSHNIVAVGCTDEAIAAAINGVIEHCGALAVVDTDGTCHALPLPIAGIMSDQSAPVVAKAYQGLSALAQTLGTPLKAPFMTLAFMSLVVIPRMKIGEQGLFDSEAWDWVEP